MPRPLPEAEPGPLDPERLRSVLWLRFFDRVLTGRLRRAFHAVRIARPGLPAVSPTLPLVVYSNHPSWWDAAVLPVVLGRLFPARRAFGPIDAEALARYPFMRKLGLFGIEAGSHAGAATFLRVGRRLLTEPDTLFCVTAQGRFADPRQRPLRLQPGLAGLVSRVAQVTVLPVAIEYPFWTERTPEALVGFGTPRIVGRAVAGSLVDLHDELERGLATTMERLAGDAAAADPHRFESVLTGASGVGGIYDAWRRLGAWRRGERFDPAHLRDEPR